MATPAAAAVSSSSNKARASGKISRAVAAAASRGRETARERAIRYKAECLYGEDDCIYWGMHAYGFDAKKCGKAWWA